MNRIGEGKVILVNEKKKYIIIEGTDGGLYVGESPEGIEKEVKIKYEIKDQSRSITKIKRLGKP